MQEEYNKLVWEELRAISGDLRDINKTLARISNNFESSLTLSITQDIADREGVDDTKVIQTAESITKLSLLVRDAVRGIRRSQF